MNMIDLGLTLIGVADDVVAVVGGAVCGAVAELVADTACVVELVLVVGVVAETAAPPASVVGELKGADCEFADTAVAPGDADPPVGSALSPPAQAETTAIVKITKQRSILVIIRLYRLHFSSWH